MVLRLAPFASGEATSGVLDAPGVCSTGRREGWAIGRWHLDEHVLEFAAVGERRHVRVRLGDIRRLEHSFRKFILVTKPVLVVTHLVRNTSRLRRVWLLNGDLPAWETELTARVPALRASPVHDRHGNVVALSNALDAAAGRTAQILDLLSAGGPTTSATLAALLRLDEDDAVMLSSVIAAEFAEIDQALGAPAVCYERHRFESATGTVRSMVWWLDRKVAAAWLMRHLPVEVHLDGDQIIVIVTVPTGSEPPTLSASVDADGCGLLLAEPGGYARHIELPGVVHDEVSVTAHSHGTVVIVARRRLGEPAVRRGRSPA